MFFELKSERIQVSRPNKRANAGFTTQKASESKFYVPTIERIQIFRHKKHANPGFGVPLSVDMW